ncbi:hypothetical protein [uncultured Ruminococcus sp.]|uniref:hypothetical protein n=1 Tax=uncultured Ruminococcus sp. TaxID=165186 RepID=UPI0026102B25|nr:hypothetical protein [uncultured Ruminococcus sp.]
MTVNLQAYDVQSRQALFVRCCLNSAVQDDTRISELMQYFKNSDSQNTMFGDLSERVKYYKETEEGVSHMCEAVRNYGDEREKIGKAEGRAEGRAEGKAEADAKRLVQLITELMKNTNSSLENALQMTGCTMEEYNNSIAFLASLEKKCLEDEN